MDSLYAVGAEGAVYAATDLRGGAAKRAVVKVPLVPYHRPAELSSSLIRHRRDSLREEARRLAKSASPYMPACHGLHEFDNPLLDKRRGGAFEEPDQALVMERLRGIDVDRWLARVHRSRIPKEALRLHLDHMALALLQAILDLNQRGYHYADLRPGNLRVFGRPLRDVRLLDAGSLVEVGDESGRFPHVPHYLPPDCFQKRYMQGLAIVPTPAVQAIMAGRTLFEITTGCVPVPGKPIDGEELKRTCASPLVADVTDGLATGSFSGVRSAIRYFGRREPHHAAAARLDAATRSAPARPSSAQRPPARPAPPEFAPLEWASPPPPPVAVRPPASPPPTKTAPRAAPPAPVARGWWRRLVDWAKRRPAVKS